MRVYLDNSATSFPKPRRVVDAMSEYMLYSGTNISRSTSSQASHTADLIFTLRETISDFFHSEDSRNVVFTKNITESFNIVIKGLFQPGDTVMVSSLEHNAVIRPLVQQGVTILPIPVSPEGKMDLDFVRQSLSSVQALICTHVSNVSGDVMPIATLSSLCQTYKVPFLLDTAQSAGLLPLDLSQHHIDCLCFTGHKALLGPTGTGGMILHPNLIERIPPFITGGTGSFSHQPNHPLLLPDKYEAGTPNIVGLIGLLEGIRSILELGLEKRWKQETELGQEFFAQLQSLKGVKILGSQDYSSKPPVFSLVFNEFDNATISYILAEKYGIDNRCGLHCSPMAHRTYLSFPHGSLRFSLSHFTTKEDIRYVMTCLKEVLGQK